VTSKFSSRSTNKTVSFGIFVLTGFVAILVHYVHGAYFRRSNGSGGLLYSVDDLPVSIVGQRPSSVVGEHWFGDLLDSHHSVATTGEGGYFGSSYLFFRLTSTFRYEIVFYLYLIIGILLLGISLRLWLRYLPREHRALVAAFHLSYPFVFALDRGQISFPYGYLITIGLFGVVSNSTRLKNWMSPVTLGIAFSMKLHPAVMAGGLLKRWSLRQYIVLGTVVTGLVGIALAASPLGISHLIYQQNSGSKYQDPTYFLATLNFNTSIRAFLEYVLSISPSSIEPILEIMTDHYQILIILVALLLLPVLISGGMSFRENLMAVAILSVSVAPIAPIYAQVAVAAAAIAGVSDVESYSIIRQVVYKAVVLISLVPHNIPLGFGPNLRESFTTQSVITPLVQCSFLLLFGVVGFRSIVRRAVLREYAPSGSPQNL
jgi:hypothetical protein